MACVRSMRFKEMVAHKKMAAVNSGKYIQKTMLPSVHALVSHIKCCLFFCSSTFIASLVGTHTVSVPGIPAFEMF